MSREKLISYKGYTIDSYYDKEIHSYTTIIHNASGHQVSDARYDGTALSRKMSIEDAKREIDNGIEE